MQEHPSITAPLSQHCEVVELRQYTLHPGRRDELVALFDREFLETQEAVGMRVMGQFRDLGDPDRFVWLRGFRDMAARAQGLQAFYGGAVWAAHRDAANATMAGSDDVLLLRPAWAGSAIATQPGQRPAPGFARPPRGIIAAMTWHLREPPSAALLALCRGHVAEVLHESGARVLGWYVTEPAANNFPRLPVREGVDVLVGFALFDDAAALAGLEASAAWQRQVVPGLAPWLAGPPQMLRLSPTARSAMHA
ncbi:MAG: NIPSNAP family protein [Ramlibacter sp.]